MWWGLILLDLKNVLEILTNRKGVNKFQKGQFVFFSRFDGFRFSISPTPLIDGTLVLCRHIVVG